LGNLNISYFANLARTNQGLFLFGDRNLQTNGVPVPSGSRLNLTTNLDVGWTREMHNEQGNVALNDGSVQHFSGKRLRVPLEAAANRTNVLLIP
jgi:prepilin-type processing-associated H-X9-DG protein